MYGYVNMIIYIATFCAERLMIIPAIVISYTSYFEFMINDMCIIQVHIFPQHLVFYFTEKMNSNCYGTPNQRGGGGVGGGGGGSIIIIVIITTVIIT